MLLASAYPLTADTAVLVAGPTTIFEPFSCNFFIASKLASAVVFESAIISLKRDEEFVSSKCLFTSFSAASTAIFADLPREDKEPVVGKIAPIINSFFFPSSLLESKELEFIIKSLLSIPLKIFVKL